MNLVHLKISFQRISESNRSNTLTICADFPRLAPKGQIEIRILNGVETRILREVDNARYRVFTDLNSSRYGENYSLIRHKV